MLTKLLVPLDGSPLAEQALGPAAAIARACGATVDLVLVHQPMAFANFPDAAWQYGPSDSERSYIASTAQELAKGASVVVSGAALRGLVAEAISARAKETEAGLIVMASHGRTGLGRAWVGSVAQDLLRRAATPILMVWPMKRPLPGQRRDARLQKILVTLDGSPLSEAILKSASDLARAVDADLILLRVVEPVPIVLPHTDIPPSYLPRDAAATAQVVEEATDQISAVGKRIMDSGLRVETHVVVADHVAAAILAFAHRVDPSVIAMSTHGRGFSRLFLGSVADKVIRGANAAMLVCRPSMVREEPPLLDDASIEAQLPALSGV